MKVIESTTNISVVANNWFPDNPGGLDRYVYELVHHLANDDTKVDLFGIGMPAQELAVPVQLRNLASPEASLAGRLWSAYRRSRPLSFSKSDAINFHFALYGLAAIPHLPDDVPITCTFHGPWAVESQQEGGSQLAVWLKQQMEQLVYNRCDRFIVLSKAFGSILNETYQVPWEKISIVPGGVDTGHFRNTMTRQQAREHLGWPQDRLILFTPRRLVHRMGLDKLIDAVARLGNQKQELWLGIAGRGPLKESLQRRVEDLDLEQSVKLLGFLPDEDLPIAYQAADLTVMPSQSLEGFGLVILESLACGTPALCTPVGGMPEIIEPFAPALVTAAASTNAIASALMEIVSGNLAMPTREECRAYAVEHFDWPHIADRVKQILLAP